MLPNARTQKEHIDAEAGRRGLANVTVITGNVVDYKFEPASFDWVVSIEASRLSISTYMWFWMWMVADYNWRTDL
ncbi:hypothetical protein TOPH_01720 [Tolypocladium ophioglossoides CBS 100239]|uniref:Uncharacterized protein n=1 Tax=Tolypocladium ophioglossoides (strain CBS 100239) TaxID=1163406 RepID=A0A0L0NHK9_TOLOC|nr:hypothetical protein TOPH_01720 [Tolypocladium ophioglossoides CBS 100239]